jgi:uncharacterized SAM-binding protein YcdF (DUF218 family)
MKRIRISWWLLGFLNAIFFVGWTPLPNSLISKIEFQYSVPSGVLNHFAGVIVLGGSGHPMYVGVTQKQIEIFRVTERMVAAAQLARDYPHLKFLYTNGSSKSKPEFSREAGSLPPQSERFFLSSGVSSSSLLLERSATNTRENAVLSAKLTGVVISQPWLLLTSAGHMPRAMATFRQVGWNVTAFPVDYKSKQSVSWLDFSLADGSSLWQSFVYELFAWAKYKILQWI